MNKVIMSPLYFIFSSVLQGMMRIGTYILPCDSDSRL